MHYDNDSIDELQKLQQGKPSQNLAQNREQEPGPGKREQENSVCQDTDSYSPEKGHIKANVHRLNFQALGKLMDEPSVSQKWLVDGMLPKGGLGLLASFPKVGKSTVSRDLARCIALGRPFLGQDVEKGKVSILTLEDIPSEVTDQFRGMGLPESPDIMICAATPPEDPVRSLEIHLNEDRPALLIIDTLVRYFQISDANDYSKVSKCFDSILKVVRSSPAQTHVLMLHHRRKGSHQRKEDGVESILGSTALSASMDTILLLSESRDVRKIRTIQRYGHNLEESFLNFDEDSGGFSLSGSKVVADLGKAKTMILDYLSKVDCPEPESMIHQHVRKRHGDVVDALRSLVNAGKVSRLGLGGKSDPFRYSVTDHSCSQNPGIGSCSQSSSPEPDDGLPF